MSLGRISLYTHVVLLFLICLVLPRLALAATYWVSPTGTAAWAACRSDDPLAGTAACSISTANANAISGDTVYIRGGKYLFTTPAINPSNSGACPNSPCTAGVGASRIVFSAYAEETVIFQQADPARPTIGIHLTNKSWIKITGITFHNFTHYRGFIYGGASYNEVSYCQFTADGAYQAMPASAFIIGSSDSLTSSRHNWIHHNYFSTVRATDPCSEATDLVRIGNSMGSPYSSDNNTTFESNYVEYGGHATLSTDSKDNVVVNNIFHNEPFISGCTNWQTATSSSSVGIGTGSKSFTTQSGLSFAPGQPIVVVAASDYQRAMSGSVTSYGGTTVVLNISKSSGSGTFSSWILSQKNVPYYETSAYNNLFGHRNVGIGNEDVYNANRNILEGNRIGFGSVNPGNGGDANLAVSSPTNIVRYNVIFGGMGISGIKFKWANAWGNQTGGVFNVVYNNTLYKNGVGWSYLYGGMNAGYSGQGIAQYSMTGQVTHNVVKNNIAYENGQGDICYQGTGNPSCTASAIETVTSNWLTTNGDPKFSNPAVTDPTSQNLFASLHGYATPPLPDLSLQASSPAIDGAAALTSANGSGTNSQTLVVEDARFFQDGTRGSDLARGVTFFPDWIAIGSVGNTVRVLAINYATNTITLANPMTWATGASIWLYKKGDGAVVLAGSGPDFGAHEYSADVPPSPPTNLRRQ